MTTADDLVLWSREVQRVQCDLQEIATLYMRAGEMLRPNFPMSAKEHYNVAHMRLAMIINRLMETMSADL